jgi:hypothetical protein
MEVGQGPNVGCSAKGKKYIKSVRINIAYFLFEIDLKQRDCLSSFLLNFVSVYAFRKVDENRGGGGTSVAWNTSSGHADDVNVLSESINGVKERIAIIFLSLSLWVYSKLNFGRFFSFLILYIIGRTHWTGDQPVARPLVTHRTT